jgi:hypothetical protein
MNPPKNIAFCPFIAYFPEIYRVKGIGNPLRRLL